MQPDIQEYNSKLSEEAGEICNRIATTIETALPEATCKIWHSHPVWFLDGNPIVGYSQQKKGIRLMFWSGADFEEDQLSIRGEKFKDASIFYNHNTEINVEDLIRWLQKSRVIQWDYKNIAKRKGQLEKLTNPS